MGPRSLVAFTRHQRLTVLVVVGLCGAMTVAAPSSEASAQELAAHCTVSPSQTQAVNAGVPAVAPGEAITVASEATFQPGVVYQDVLKRPDGSTYYSTYVELNRPASALVLQPDSIQFRLNGIRQPVVSGTAPVSNGFAMESMTSGDQRTWRVYFPGDVTAILAGATGAGVPSYTFAQLTVASLSVIETVPSSSDITAGVLFNAAACAASASTGPSNVATAEATATISIAEPLLALEKQTKSVSASMGDYLEYMLKVTAPEVDSQGNTPAVGYSTQVVDQLPVEVVPVDGNGGPLAPAATTPEGGVWDPAHHTLTFALGDTAPGFSTTITYRVLVDAAPTGSTLRNDAHVVTHGLNATSGGGRVYDPAATAHVSIPVAGGNPTIDKHAEVSSVPGGVDVPFRLTVTLPPENTFFDLVVDDELPESMEFGSFVSVTCPGGCPSNAVNLDPLVRPDGTIDVGWFLGDFSSDPLPRTIEIVYTARFRNLVADKVVDQYAYHANGTRLDLGSVATNTARVLSNSVERLGGVVPSLVHLGNFDSVASAQANLEYHRPILGVAKSVITPTTPYDPDPNAPVTYVVTVTNTGDTAAYGIQLDDNLPRQIDPGSVDTSAFDPSWIVSGNGSRFTIPGPVAPGAVITLRYSAKLAEKSGVTDASIDITNTVRISEFRDGPDLTGYLYNDELSASATFRQAAPKLQLDKKLLSPNPTGIGGSTQRWSLTVSNVGNGTAVDVKVSDPMPAGLVYVEGSITSPAQLVSGTSADFEFPAGFSIAAGGSTSFEFETTPSLTSPGAVTNTASVVYKDGAQHTQAVDPSGTAYSYTASASASVTFEAPKLEIVKLPKAAPNTIIEGGTATWTIQVTNTSGVDAGDVTVTDPVPDPLRYDPNAAIFQLSPIDPVDAISESISGKTVTWTLGRLKPGQTLTIYVPVAHSSKLPYSGDPELVNTATATARGLAEPVQDSGVMIFVPDRKPPVVTKTVTPDRGAPGTPVEYTLTFTLVGQTQPVFDATAIDALPDGIDFVSYDSVACVSGTCSDAEFGTSPRTLPPVAQPDGSTTLGWYFGDYAAGFIDATWQMKFRGVIDDTFTDTTGVRRPGTQVQEGVFTPLVNTVRPFGDGLDAIAGPLTAIPSTPSSTFDFRGAVARAPFVVETPRVTVAKSATPAESGPGESVHYTVRVTNAGSQPAYRIQVRDDMGADTPTSSRLRSFVSTPPVGVTVVDGFSYPADPDVVWQVDQLSPGQTVTIDYDATNPPAAELFPSPSTDYRDVARVTNKVTVPSYHSALDPTDPADTTYSDLVGVKYDSDLYTPLPFASISGCIDPTATLTSLTLQLRNSLWENGHGPGGLVLSPGFPTVGTHPGTLYGAKAVVTFISELTLFTVAAGGTWLGIRGLAPFRMPDSLVTLNGMTTASWDLGDHPYDTAAADGLMMRLTFATTPLASGSVTATLTGNDVSGSPSRGVTAGAPYLYQRSAASNTCGTPSDPTVTATGFSKTPDTGGGAPYYAPGDPVNWSLNFTAADGVVALNPVVTDEVPYGVIYTPGTAQFSVGSLDGSSTPALTETITPLPGGRTRVTWAGWSTLTQLSVTVPTVVDPSLRANAYSPVNQAFLDSDNHVTDGRCFRPDVLCDRGSVFVFVPHEPVIDKTVDHGADRYGTTFTYTLDVTIPSNQSYSDVVVVDDLTQDLLLSMQPGATVMADCISGCDDPAFDIAPATMAGARTVGGHTYQGWTLGDLTAAPGERVVRLRYVMNAPSLVDALAVQQQLTTFSNTATVFHSADDPFNEGFEADPSDPMWYESFVAALASGLLFPTDSGSARVSVEYPVLEMSKQCNPWQPERVLAGFNVTCYLTFHNTATFVSAYDVTAVDTPERTGTWEDNLAGTGSYMLNWSYQGVAGPAQVTEPWDGVSIGVTTQPGVEVPAQGSVAIAIHFRVNGWGFESNLTSDWSTAMGTAVNSALIQPWADHDGGPPIIDVNRTEASASLQFLPTNLVAAKALIGATRVKDGVQMLTDSCAAPRLDATCVSGRFVQVGAVHTWQIDLGIDQLQDFNSVNVADTLPVGFSYVPGSARVMSGWDASTSTLLNDPSVAASANGCGTSDSGHRGGSTLSWSFRKNSADPSTNILWRNPGWARVPVTGVTLFPHQHGVRILIDVMSNTGCTAGGVVTDRYTNALVVEGTTSTGSIRRSGSLGDALVLNPMTLSKTPDDGYVSDGMTGYYDVYLDWWFDGSLEPPSDGTKPKAKAARSFQKVPPNPGSGTPAATNAYVAPTFTLTDVFHDQGFYVPNSSNVEILPGDGTAAIPATMTETMTRTGSFDTTVTTLSWNLTTPVPPAHRISDCSPGSLPNWPSCIAPTRVHIRVPVPVPPDTADGTLLPNSVTAGLDYSVNCLATGSGGAGLPPKGKFHTFGEKAPAGGTATGSNGCEPCPAGSAVATPAKEESSAPWTTRKSKVTSFRGPLAFDGTKEGGGGGAGSPTCVAWPIGSWSLSDDGLITVVNPSPPPTPIKSGDPVRAVGTRVDWTVDIELGPKKVWFDLYYLDTVPSGVSFGGYGSVDCESSGFSSCPSLAAPETIAPVVHADGTTTIGWWFGDVAGLGQPRKVHLHLWGIVLNVASTVDGTILTNRVSGWSNDVDKLSDAGDVTGATMDYASAVATWDTVIREPKLSITKRPLVDGPLSEGELSRWSVEVVNSGEVDVYDFNVTDTPAASLENVRGTVASSPASTTVVATKGWTPADSRLEWWVDRLHPGDRLEFVIEGPVIANYLAEGFSEAKNEARAGPWQSAPGDSDQIRWYPSVRTEAEIPLAGPRLSIEKYSGDGCAQRAQDFTVGVESRWCVVVANVGNREATNVTVDDYLPPRWTFVGGSATPMSPVVALQPNGNQHLSWSIGLLKPGAANSITLRYSTLPLSGAPLESQNVAVASATLADGSTPPPSSGAYRSISDAQAQQVLAGLEISKTPDFQALGILPGGGDVGWDIQVSNPTSTGVTGVRLTDFLPAGLALVSQSCNVGVCTGVQLVSQTPQATGRTAILWTVDALGPRQSFTVHLRAHLPASASLEERFVNHVEVEANEVRMVANQASVLAYVPASVGDRVWLDTDSNGVQDSGESGVGGVSVMLLDNAGTILKSTVTDQRGEYLFEGLTGGSYQIRFERAVSDQRPWTSRLAGTDRAVDSDARPVDGMTDVFDLATGENRRDLDAGIIADVVKVPEAKVPTNSGGGSSGGGSRLAVTGVDLLGLFVGGTLIGGVGLVATAWIYRPRRRRRPGSVN